MAIDARQATASRFDPYAVTVSRDRLVFFAEATGQRDPIYRDLDAAEAAGHPDLPIPPSFYFSLELERPDPFGWLTALGVDLLHVLHGEQSFTYHALAHAGETLTVASRIVDVSVKKGGALELLTKQTEVTRGSELITEATTVLIVRHPEPRP